MYFVNSPGITAWLTFTRLKGSLTVYTSVKWKSFYYALHQKREFSRVSHSSRRSLSYLFLNCSAIAFVFRLEPRKTINHRLKFLSHLFGRQANRHLNFFVVSHRYRLNTNIVNCLVWNHAVLHRCLVQCNNASWLIIIRLWKSSNTKYYSAKLTWQGLSELLVFSS